MKKIISLLFALIIFLSNNQSFTQATFVNKVRIKAPFPYRGLVNQLTSGNILASSTTDSGFYISGIKQNGNVIWEKVYGNGTSEDINTCATADKGFICYGNMNDYITGNKIISLFKCDSTGKIEWSKGLKLDYSNNYIYPEKFIVDKQNNYVIVYRLLPKKGGTEQIRLVKFDKSGNIIFKTGLKNIYNSGYQYLHIKALAEFNGNYIIGFTYQNALIGYTNSFIMLIDSLGNPVSYRPFNIDVLSIDDYSTPLYFFKVNNTYNVLGYYQHWQNLEYKEFYYFATINKDSTTTTGTAIPNNRFALQRYLKKNKIPLHNIEGYVFNSKNIIAEDHLVNAFYVKEYDSLGKVCPDYILPDYEYSESSKKFYLDDEISGVQKVIDDIQTTDENFSVLQVHLSKNECAGEASTFTNNSNLNSQEKKAVFSTLFPNPAHNTITISIPSIKNQQLQLYNAEGKLLQSIQVKNQQVTLNILQYKNGFYIIKIVGSDQTEILKFIKQ